MNSQQRKDANTALDRLAADFRSVGAEVTVNHLKEPAAGQAAHTATPWAVEGSFVIHPASGMTVADCQLHRDTPEEKGEDEANAAFIVTACNAHAGLVAALESAEERIIELSKWANIPAEGQTLDDLRAALANLNR